LVTGQPDAALDGVYKLSMSGGKPRLKLSDSLQKVTLPGVKQVLRTFGPDGLFAGADAIILDGEPAPEMMFHPAEPHRSLSIAHWRHEPLLHKVMERGERLRAPQAISEITAYATARLALLPAEYRRFENPHTYKVGISGQLLELREQLRQRHVPAQRH
jgi:nicotinate phosphoribosyltransferase